MWVTKRGVVRWVRPTIEHAQASGWRDQEWGIFLWSLCAESLFVFNILFRFSVICFSLFKFGCVLFSKTESFGLDLSLDFFVFYLIVVKIESGLQKNNLFNFILV